MTQKDFYKITDYIRKIIEGTSFENHVFAVGGSVRDLAMNNEIKDIDLVIDLPNGGVDFAEWCREQGYTKTIVVYQTYGTSMFKFNQFPDEEIECVMTRGEKYIDKESRNPVTVFADINEDAIRRDLTINALYYNISASKILDLVGGVNDIEKQIIRTTNENPDVVFDDDPLRILRVIRFSTRYGWKIEDKTFQSMKKFVDRLSIITKERIRDEFNKILLCKNAVMGINILHEIGAMKYIIPEFEQCYGMTQNGFHFGDVAEHTLAVLDHHCREFQNENSLTERLACLLHDIGKIKTKTIKDGKIHFYDHEYYGAKMCIDILKALKYDNDTIDEVSFLIKNHMRTKQAGEGGKLMKDKSLNKLLYDCKTFERFESLMRVIECDNMSHKAEHNIPGQYVHLVLRVKQEGNHMKMFGYKLPITGNDIMESLNIGPCSMIAEINDRLIKRAFHNPDLGRNECLKMLPGIKKEIENSKK